MKMDTTLNTIPLGYRHYRLLGTELELQTRQVRGTPAQDVHHALHVHPLCLPEG